MGNYLTLQELIEANPYATFRIVHGGTVDGLPSIVVHPDGEDGEALDYLVEGDMLMPNNDIWDVDI